MRKIILLFALYTMACATTCTRITLSIDETGTIIAYEGKVTKIDIPDQIDGIPVTAIGKNVFFYKDLTSVTIPDSVIYIRYGAFACNPMTFINIPDSVVFIDNGAFSGCFLNLVYLSANVEYIGAGAFQLNQLYQVYIPSKVSYIGDRAFLLNRLVSVNISADSISIGKNAFSGNNIIRITIGSDATLAGGGSPSFGNDFDNYYDDNGKKAGTYEYSNGQWSMK